MQSRPSRDLLFLKLLKKISDNCRTYRIARGWEPIDLSAIAQVSSKTIYDIENGIGNVTLRTLINISHALEIEVNILIQ